MRKYKARHRGDMDIEYLIYRKVTQRFLLALGFAAGVFTYIAVVMLI